ncbi:MAG: magnesium-translocating P-type ATPase [Alphaproteobacteria bacterium]|nr:magnesium-translocating P-type ATPase [Alphaproteobacteria bacterium]
MQDARAAMPFWSQPAGEVIAGLGASLHGLGSQEAAARLRQVGPNVVADTAEMTPARLLLRQFESPLVLILIFGAGVSLVLREWVDASIILAIVLGSALLGFYQEFRASQAVAALKRRLALTARVLRDGGEAVVPVGTLVPGDVVLLSAGNLVPADALILEAKDFLVSEASLTGESFPVEKQPGVLPADAPIGRRTNAVFLGSSVRSGTARAVVVATGQRTAFGAIAARIAARAPETEFARGVRHFGAMLVRVMILIVLFVLTVNQMLGRPVADSLLFAVALAVGLSPELLPAIVSVTLSAGARHLAKGGVIVRRLEAIENLGSMDVLCTDKTGTLTEGAIVLDGTVDADGQASTEVRGLAFLNAALETGIANPLDAAIVAMGEREKLSADGVRKIDEIPYDFIRRRLTIVIEDRDDPAFHRIISKGAFANVLESCRAVRREGAERVLDDDTRQALEAFFRRKSEDGFRVLAVAERRVKAKPGYGHADENGLVFAGFLLFLDPPKPEAAATIRDLAAFGIAIKVVSGDNRYVTAHVARTVGLDPGSVLTGEDLAAMKDEALWHVAPLTDLFVEIDPQQKERIVRALQRTGHAVGFMGDGINDAPALHAADVGISVDTAVDVARESADVILLRRDLDVLRQGVEDGRRTFANTLKYIGMTTSANFGNMISMALATPLLPFLPLLPKQILLNNFLSDLPSIAISTDRVDREHVVRPQRWNVAEVRRFMVVFGLVSSMFDLLTFALLLLVFRAGEATFQTAWFLVSVLTELAVVLVLRTALPAYRSRPSRLLLWSTLAVAAATLAAPFLGPASAVFDFVPLSPVELAAAIAVVCGYIAATEAAKRWFYKGRTAAGSRPSTSSVPPPLARG